MTGREWRFPALGGLAILFALTTGYWLRADSAPRESPPTVAPSPALPASEGLQPTPPTLPSTEGLRLHGVTGAGAIIGGADGRQRLVLIGREILPGLVLARVARDYALLRGPGGDVRLDFSGATPAPSAPAAAMATPSEAAIREDELRYRIAFAPRRIGGRVNSHELRAGQSVPALERAGLLSGDIVLRVNGSEFDQERMMELPRTIANSDRIVFDIERGGRSMRLEMTGHLSR